jgi:hypothetical protein
MAEHETEVGSDGGQPGLPRRAIVATIAVGYAASSIPQAWATGPARGYAALVVVSEYLTGRRAV